MMNRKHIVALVAASAAWAWIPTVNAAAPPPKNQVKACIKAGNDALTCLCPGPGGPCEGAAFQIVCGEKGNEACKHFDHHWWEDEKQNARADFYDLQGNLLYTDEYIIPANEHHNHGNLEFVGTGNLDRVEFDRAYRNPATTILNRSDLVIKITVTKNSGKSKKEEMIVKGLNVSYSHALWCEHSGDSAGIQQQIDALIADIKAHEILDNQRFLAEEAARKAGDAALQAALDAEIAARKQGDIDTLAAANAYTDAVRVQLEAQIQAEAMARAAADALITAALNSEIAARKAADMLLQAQIDAETMARMAADAALQAALAAETAARIAGDAATLAAANAYTDSQTPWPDTCPNADDHIAWDGVKWICQSHLTCPSGDPNTPYIMVADNNAGNYPKFVCRAMCFGEVVDPQNDKNHCGGCGNFCFNTFEVNDTGCQAGGCVVTSCNAGFLDCDGQYPNGCECFVPNGSPKCGMGGVCQVDTCNAGFANCNGVDADGCEVDLNADSNNCGACGNVCPMGQQCGGGVCQAFFNWQGVILNTPKAQFTGWQVCFQQPYGTFGPSLGQIQAQCPLGKIAYTCAPNGSGNYQVAAWAPRGDVFFQQPDCSNQTRLANGAYWYFNQSCSMGFTPHPQISQNSADTQDAPGFANNFNTGASRVSWHTGGGQINGGWRCGNTTFLNGEPSGFTRFILQAP